MLVVAVLLAIVFAIVVTASRRASIREEREEMEVTFRAIARLPYPRFSVKELSESGTNIEARVFAADGHLVDFRGRMPVPPADLREGFALRAHWLFFAGPSGNDRVVLAQNLHEIEEGVRGLTKTLFELWIPLVVLVGGATWLGAQSVFRPLTRLADGAKAIQGSDLSQRLVPPDEAEFGALTATLNEMLARIEDSTVRSKRFADDAAHELRTPLAILRTQIETTLLRSRSESEYVASHETLLREVERVTTIVEALLQSARASSQPAPVVDLTPLVREAAERCSRHHLRIEIEEVRAAILPEEFGIVLDNLLDNACRYAPPDTEIVVTLERCGPEVELRVADHGAGIRPGDAERIFDRFYRVDEHRNRASGGLGIGLALCRQIVEDRGGTIAATETSGGGATMVVRLPTAR